MANRNLGFRYRWAE